LGNPGERKKKRCFRDARKQEKDVLRTGGQVKNDRSAFWEKPARAKEKKKI